LQHKVNILEIKVNTLETRLDHYRASTRHAVSVGDELVAINNICNLQNKYTALLEKLGLEEVEVKAGIKLVDR